MIGISFMTMLNGTVLRLTMEWSILLPNSIVCCHFRVESDLSTASDFFFSFAKVLEYARTVTIKDTSGTFNSLMEIIQLFNINYLAISMLIWSLYVNLWTQRDFFLYFSRYIWLRCSRVCHKRFTYFILRYLVRDFRYIFFQWHKK